MNSKERWLITSILLVTALIIGTDIFTDYREGVHWWHLAAEALVAVSAIFGVFYLVAGSISLKHSLESERKASGQLREEAEKWKRESNKYILGLSLAIDSQLTEWKLTNSEKEVAFLLLKGLSLKEIAEARKTSERTARAQAVSIYSKSGVTGRPELSAFFLEDLLPPTKQGADTT